MYFRAALLVALAAGVLADATTTTTPQPSLVPPTAVGRTNSSFQIPPHHANGVYIYDSTTGKHTMLRTLDTSPASNKTALHDPSEATFNPYSAKFGRRSTALPDGDITCYDTVLAALDYQQITYSFTQSCTGQSIPKGHNLYVYYDGFTAAMCNDGGANPCSSAEFKSVLSDIAGTCHNPNMAGFEYTKKWAKGYGIYSPNVGHLC